MVRSPADGAVGPRASADYYDVWSSIFKDSFFGEQANWAKAHNVEYLVHLVDEETMIGLERSEGDYFRDDRYVQVPGIDNLSQLVPSAVHRADGTWSINNNFPKLASSAAHLFGKPEGLGGRGRRLGRRRQVPDELPTGARGERAAGPGPGARRWRGEADSRHRPAGTAGSTTIVVCQPRQAI